MVSRREFVRNGFFICVGTGGILTCERAGALPSSGGRRWTMIIDGNRCTGCQSCMVACKLQSNSAPGQFHTRVSEQESGVYPHGTIRFVASLCRHCDNPPCVAACRTGAAFVHDSGLVMTDWRRCDGNGACIRACPHGARWPDPRFGDRADKCDLCIHRIGQGLEPACVENCASKARVFGRLDRPEGEFSRYLARLDAKRLKTGAVHLLGGDEKGERS
ncbi:MAG: 4Fe-4S dicluster domain-containing protein [Desulfatitalea sp.]|nr:4Fe-4S dicluster domain-containing protein [Desulfatitalea sp.]NNJ99171.1 4Fe-4S dicluster domain-containing protein [Desulfatitalea sp.]